jgi:CheY-like chemotaxis protein
MKPRGIHNVATKDQIGNILVGAGIISLKTLERALELQQGSDKRLGELLRDMGIVKELEVIEALARQSSLKIIRNFADRPFPKELLDLVPEQMALEKMIFPLKLHDRVLALATLDPFDGETFALLSRKIDMQIYLVLATSEDITEAIRKHYLKVEKFEKGRPTILIIDDSQITSQILDLALRKEGYEVLVAGDGIEGLKLVIPHHPDLIVCDLFMPRMDGYAFILSLKKHADMAAIPVILLTAKDSTEEEYKALKAGFVDFIGKPATPARVIARIKRTFALKGNKQVIATHIWPHLKTSQDSN